MEVKRTSGSPLYTIAAIALILFSGVGVATMLGWIPGSQSKPAETTPAGLPLAGSPPPLDVSAAPAGLPPPGSRAQAGMPPPGSTVRAGVPPPGNSLQNAVPPPASKVLAGLPPPGVDGSQPVPCAHCGVVRSVQMVEVKGEGSGLGAVAGGVLGAVVGHQVGQGNGNTLATLIGAGGGALAGNAVEKNVKQTRSWKVSVDMSDGSNRTFSFANPPAFAAGDHVKVSKGVLVAD